jgi:hypothetical protein
MRNKTIRHNKGIKYRLESKLTKQDIQRNTERFKKTKSK